jgi:tetratricopeptide (TPR) repeat protein
MKKHWNWILSLLVIAGGSSSISIASFVLPVQAQISQNHALEAYELFQQGQQQYDSGKTQEAITSWQQALQIIEQSGDRYRQGLLEAFLGTGHLKLGEFRQSLEYFQHSLEIVREFKDRKMEGGILLGVGAAYSGLGDYQNSIEFCSQGLAIAREIGDRELEGIILLILSHAHFALGQIQQGSEYLQQARALQADPEKPKINKEIF